MVPYFEFHGVVVMNVCSTWFIICFSSKLGLEKSLDVDA